MDIGTSHHEQPFIWSSALHRHCHLLILSAALPVWNDIGLWTSSCFAVPVVGDADYLAQEPGCMVTDAFQKQRRSYGTIFLPASGTYTVVPPRRHFYSDKNMRVPCKIITYKSNCNWFYLNEYILLILETGDVQHHRVPCEYMTLKKCCILFLLLQESCASCCGRTLSHSAVARLASAGSAYSSGQTSRRSFYSGITSTTWSVVTRWNRRVTRRPMTASVSRSSPLQTTGKSSSS